MIWLTWRQFRAQTRVALAAVVLLAAALAASVPHLASCTAAGGSCAALTAEFLRHNHSLYRLGGILVIVAPAIIGTFWGAPLVTRELEAGTFRLAWSQSVTRTRWITVKLTIIGLAAMATAGLLSLMVTWWAGPIDRISMNRLTPALFSERGVVPVGYAAFAFALGVTAGILIRRTVPAMAVTLAAVPGAEIAMPLWIRPHLISPVHITTAITAANIQQEISLQNGPVIVTVGVHQPGAWIVSNQTINQAGHVVKGVPSFFADCGGTPAPARACFARLARLGYRQLVGYQPASRFWALQWYETAIFLAVALALAGICFWRVRRRRLS